MKKILILSLVVNFLYSGEKRDLVQGAASSSASKRLAADVDEITSSIAESSIQEADSVDGKLRFLLNSLPDDLKDKILGFYFDNIGLSYTKYTGVENNISLLIESKNDSRPTHYKMSLDSFRQYLKKHLMIGEDLFRGPSDWRSEIIFVCKNNELSIDDFEASIATECVDEIVYSSDEITTEILERIQKIWYSYKSDSAGYCKLMLNLYKKFVPELKDKFLSDRGYLIFLGTKGLGHYYYGFEMVLKIYQLSCTAVKCPLINNIILKGSSYLESHVDKVSIELEKLEDADKKILIEFIFEKNYDIALLLAKKLNNPDFYLYIRLKKFYPTVLGKFNNQELCDFNFLKVCQSEPEEFKQEIFFYFFQKAYRFDLENVINSIVFALWPDEGQSKKIELALKGFENLMSKEHYDENFFRCLSPLLKQLELTTRLKFKERFLQAPDEFLSNKSYTANKILPILKQYAEDYLGLEK